MASQGYVILIEQDRCAVFPAGDASMMREMVITPSESPDAFASACAELLNEMRYSGEPALLAIPSSWCLAASFSSEGLPAKHRTNALQYRFEEQLPLAAEDLAMGFIEQGQSALGIGVELPRLRPLVDALESRGIAVECIVPSAILIADAVVQDSDASSCIVCIEDHETLQLMRIEDRRMTRWHSLPWHSKRLSIVIQQMTSISNNGDEPVAICVANEGDEASHGIGFPEQWRIERCHKPRAELIAEVAPQILAGSAAPPVNLRSGSLSASDPWRHVRGAARALVAAAILLVIALNAVMLYRGVQYRAIADRHDATVTATFKQALPDYNTVPAQPRRTMENELRRMRGLSGQQLDRNASAETVASHGALNILNDCLQRLPIDLRYTILDLRIDKDEIHFRGHARSHSEADQIASALRRDGRFEVEPPHTVKLKDKDKTPGGVEFTLRCKWLAPDTPPEVKQVDAPSESQTAMTEGAR